MRSAARERCSCWQWWYLGLPRLPLGLRAAFYLAMLALIIVGAADTVSTIIRNTIRQLSTPDYIRGRMTSVNQIFFQGGPQLGEVEAGLVAQLFGAPFASHQRRRGLHPGSHLDRPPLATDPQIQR